MLGRDSVDDTESKARPARALLRGVEVSSSDELVDVGNCRTCQHADLRGGQVQRYSAGLAVNTEQTRSTRNRA